jgi:hypothetical protein
VLKAANEVSETNSEQDEVVMADTEALFQRKFKRIAAPSSKGSEFSLVGYNILCDAVFHNGSAKYPYITDEALKCRGPDPSIAPRHTQLIKEVIYIRVKVKL